MIEEYLKSISNSVNSVFAMMIQAHASAQPVIVMLEYKAMGDVTGLIEVKGDKIYGSAAVSFSSDLVKALTKKMLQYDAVEIDEVAQDLAKEMTNMVIGGAKSEMDNKGYHSEMSVPSLVMGKGVNISTENSAQVYVQEFRSDVGDFWVELCLQAA